MTCTFYGAEKNHNRKSICDNTSYLGCYQKYHLRVLGKQAQILSVVFGEMNHRRGFLKSFSLKFTTSISILLLENKYGSTCHGEAARY